MKYLLLLLPLLLFGCDLRDPSQGPVTTEIRKGSRWTLRTGSSPEEVYAQLQALGREKALDRVGVVGRMPAARPAELKSDLALYDFLTLETSTGRTERVVFRLGEAAVVAIEAGGALPDSVGRWPAENSIFVGDPLEVLPEKLRLIYQQPEYAGYVLSLPDKPLRRAYDPGMAEFSEWAFTFEEGAAEFTDRFSVRLYFEGTGLETIRVTHQRFETVN
ncbi:hypothetical protein CLV84_1014 [Neolewinella xylanilytica]|uniref:Uncharacterized protein n=1 Tax=Neolewinella xylanilytica TaxID=1514080 RepID=A0A2S6I980_9BACT|nr:hypothetical protein [Neolewinella xylanilytica]PPK88051.1 hypothetical protein CLV84_1014 [Neolewinella xylanilytica]